MLKFRIFSVVLIVFVVLVLIFVQKTELEGSRFPFHFGLDLKGGSHLVYQADTSGVEKGKISEAMSSLREVIERRVNVFGVSEPIVQVEKGGIIGGEEERLIVELPGVTDLKTAIDLIGKTPLLEFKLFSEESEVDATVNEDGVVEAKMSFEDTGLTGSLLEKSTLAFDNVTSQPLILLSFNEEGRELFAEITRNNVGRVLAIFLDGQIISDPVVREEIRDGNAQISGSFTPEEARQLVRDLNFGALPVPIELLSTQSIGASLGEKILQDGVKAGIWGLILVISFMILWYRLPGIVASIALLFYILIMLSLFKLIPVTLTAAGIAGFILSIGMAVDANVLIFERLKEELRSGKLLPEAIRSGTSRAWISIRDSNISSFLTAIVLFWFGSSLIKGFALVFGLGILVSMFTAITITRTFLLAVSSEKKNKTIEFLFGSGTK